MQILLPVGVCIFCLSNIFLSLFSVVRYLLIGLYPFTRLYANMQTQSLLAAATALALLSDVALAWTEKCIITIRKNDPALGKHTLYDMVSLPPDSDYTFGKFPPATAGVTIGVDDTCRAGLVVGDLNPPYDYRGMENPFYGLTGVELVRQLHDWRENPENVINFSLW